MGWPSFHSLTAAFPEIAKVLEVTMPLTHAITKYESTIDEKSQCQNIYSICLFGSRGSHIGFLLCALDSPFYKIGSQWTHDMRGG